MAPKMARARDLAGISCHVLLPLYRRSTLTRQPAPNRQTTVDACLSRRRGNTDCAQDLRQVVRNDTVPDPLGVETDAEKQVETLLVAGSPEKRQVRSSRCSGSLRFDGRLHLFELVSVERGRSQTRWTDSTAIFADTYCTNSSSSLPFAWNFANTRKASSVFPLETSHRGDSGQKMTSRTIWMEHGTACMRTGSLKDQSPLMLSVPKVNYGEKPSVCKSLRDVLRICWLAD